MSKKDLVEELHRGARKIFIRRPYEMRGINDTFQADIIEMIPYSEINKGYKYILAIIDTFSEYAWTFPLKTKTGKEVTDAVKIIFNKYKRIPKNIHTDQGKEFFNTNFKQLMNQNSINHYHTYSKLKASIVERFNRTLLSKLYKHFSLSGLYRWENVLKKFTKEYNNSKHRTIKMKPIEVTKENEADILKNAYRKNTTINVHEKRKLNVGDNVRISKFKTIFEKVYTPNWSTEVFKIQRVLPTTPITYILTDLNKQNIAGCFYGYELQKTKYPNLLKEYCNVKGINYMLSGLVTVKKKIHGLTKKISFKSNHNKLAIIQF